MKDQEIRQRLYDLRRESQARYLRLLGVDVDKFQALDRAIDGEFRELADGLQKQSWEEGKARAEQQAKIVEAGRAALNQDAEQAMHADLSTQAAILDHLSPQLMDVTQLMPIWWCHCHYATSLSSNLGYGDEIIIDPPGGAGQAAVTYDPSLNQARPRADVSGGGAGTINTAHINPTWFRFAFTPSTSGTYCIRPVVSMNGWWLLWTWGTCNPQQASGSGMLYVKLRVRVSQLATTVKQIEHTVLDKSAPPSGEGAIDYVSERDGGAKMSVYLQGGHEAVIFVECEVFTQVTSYGRALVDMQGSSGFYFWVHEVRVGRRHCHWPWIPPLIPAEILSKVAGA
jgi:hypothetical protein